MSTSVALYSLLYNTLVNFDSVRHPPVRQLFMDEFCPLTRAKYRNSTDIGKNNASTHSKINFGGPKLLAKPVLFLGNDALRGGRFDCLR